jgi:hypothetical protein
MYPSISCQSTRYMGSIVACTLLVFVDQRGTWSTLWRLPFFLHAINGVHGNNCGMYPSIFCRSTGYMRVIVACTLLFPVDQRGTSDKLWHVPSYFVSINGVHVLNCAMYPSISCRSSGYIGRNCGMYPCMFWRSTGYMR